MLNDYKYCKVCKEEVKERSHFYKQHKIKESLYYQTYFTKKDLHTGELLPFKSLDSYIFNNFANKNNLKNYLKSLSQEDAIGYCIEQLRLRKELKNLKYTPTQVELRSILCPSILYLDKIFKDKGGYYKVCEELGYINRFKDISLLSIKDLLSSKNDGLSKIIVDSREQNSLKIDYNTEIQGLKFGDYTLDKPELCGSIYFERKEIKDFISTVTKDIERFKRELQRAKDNNAYVIILVESSLTNTLSFNYLPHVKKFVKISPEAVFHNVRLLIQEFENCQFVFVSGRVKAAELVKRILLSNGDIKNYDIQYLIDLKLI